MFGRKTEGSGREEKFPPSGGSEHRLWLSTTAPLGGGEQPSASLFRAEARTHFYHGGIHLKKKVNRTKPISLTFRVTERDAGTIRRNAKSAGMDLTKYLTTCAIGKEIVHIDGLDDCARALRRQGTNLNQLATLANMGRVSSVKVSETYELYLEIQKLLKEILERKV